MIIVIAENLLKADGLNWIQFKKGCYQQPKKIKQQKQIYE
jgi:hypothetical protein